MKEIDDTDPNESESEVTRELDILPLERLTRQLVERIEVLETEVADLHHRRRVSRQQATDQDPEWH